MELWELRIMHAQCRACGDDEDDSDDGDGDMGDYRWQNWGPGRVSNFPSNIISWWQSLG